MGVLGIGGFLSRIKSSLCIYALESPRKSLDSGVIICISNIFLSEDYKKEETQGEVIHKCGDQLGQTANAGEG